MVIVTLYTFETDYADLDCSVGHLLDISLIACVKEFSKK
jgi:hypothetical protein